MKKIILSTYDNIRNPFYAGGGARAIHSLARTLRNQYDITVVTSLFTTTPVSHIDGVRYISVGPHIHHPQLSQLLYSQALFTAARQLTYDLWIENFTPPFSSSFIPLSTHKPVIGLAHMLAGRHMDSAYKIPIFSLVEKKALQHYTTLIALTDRSKQKLMQLVPHARVVTIPNGITLPTPIKSQYPRRDWLYLGRVDDAQKDFQLLIRAFERAARYTNWNLIIAGSGPHKEENRLIKRIAVSPYSHRIQRLGRVEGREKERLLFSAAGLILTSRYETQPLSILEAASHNLPLLVPRTQDFSWVSSEIALKVKRNAALYADAMLTLTRPSPVLSRRVLAARRFATRYSWKKVTGSYANLIEEVL